MAASFNATTSIVSGSAGSGQTVMNATAQYSIAAWFKADSQGENSNGRILCLHPSVRDRFIWFITGAGLGDLTMRWSSAADQTRWGAENQTPYGKWIGFAATHVRGQAPAIWLRSVEDGSGSLESMTVGLIGGSGGDGDLVSANTGFTIGNNRETDRTWDGQIAHVMFWDNQILSEAELDFALKYPYDATPTSHWPLLNDNTERIGSLVATDTDVTYDGIELPYVSRSNSRRSILITPGNFGSPMEIRPGSLINGVTIT